MDAQHQAAMEIVEDYKAYLEDVAYVSWAYTLAEYSYAMTTVNEIILMIEKSSDVPPLEIIENYSNTMFDYYGKKRCPAFLVAYKTTADLISLFM